jgi:hypothetical protein
MVNKSNVLAERLEQGAAALLALAGTLSDAEWQTRMPHDGRKIGVIVHHVASVYPVEIHLAQVLAGGEPVGATWDDVHKMNAGHAAEHDGVTREETLELLRKNSAVAAAAIRALNDEQLANGNTIAMYANAPLTCQFMLEDHAVRHSYHHAAKIRAALNR